MITQDLHGDMRGMIDEPQTVVAESFQDAWISAARAVRDGGWDKAGWPAHIHRTRTDSDEVVKQISSTFIDMRPLCL